VQQKACTEQAPVQQQVCAARRHLHAASTLLSRQAVFLNERALLSVKHEVALSTVKRV
jgi:hypothetical protein